TVRTNLFISERLSRAISETTQTKLAGDTAAQIYKERHLVSVQLHCGEHILEQLFSTIAVVRVLPKQTTDYVSAGTKECCQHASKCNNEPMWRRFLVRHQRRVQHLSGRIVFGFLNFRDFVLFSK